MKEHNFKTLAFGLLAIGYMNAQHNQQTGPLAKNVSPERNNFWDEYTK
ncbi:hypothetical protein [Allomuricauda sp. CP2A]|nr:hypothetical protein [Muricauda sp. CP2A]